MKRRIQSWLAALVFATSVGGVAFSVASPQTALAQGCNQTLPGTTIPTWYKGIVGANCEVLSPEQVGGLSAFIWKIVLNIIEMMLHLVGYASVGFIIFGGFKYMYSAGAPDGLKKAKDTILNAVIGLVISIISIGIVNVAAGAF